MELTTLQTYKWRESMLFMMSKIQNLNGTHNLVLALIVVFQVVYDVKDTKFEWNSQRVDM